MFITSFEEQNITYRSCSNLRIHLLTNSIKSKEVPVQKAVKIKEAKHTEHKNIQDHSPTVETSQNTETSEINNAKPSQNVSESKPVTNPSSSDWLNQTFNPDLL